MKTLNKALCAAVALALPGVALSDNPAWTYGQVGYYKADSGDDSTDGYRIKGSLGFAENFHFQAEWLDGDLDESFYGSSTDFDGYRIVLGANPSVGANTDAVVQIQYFDLDYDYTGGKTTVDGWGVGGGIRHMIADRVEVNGMIWWNEAEWEDKGSNYTEDFSDVSLEIGGRYLFTDALSVGLTVVTNDPIAEHSDSLTIDLRWQFNDLF